MTYTLVSSEIDLTGKLPTEEVLSCFDTIGDFGFTFDCDFLLHERSAMEFVRDQLDDRQRADLDRIDAYWRAHIKTFNEDFAMIHARKDVATELDGFVEDSQGRAPAIPRSHWWFWPIRERAD